MSYLKRLVTGFCLSTLFTMEMPFNGTPVANAQPAGQQNCILNVLAGAARMPVAIVAERINFMDGPDLPAERVQEGLGILGLGTGNEQRFFTREQLERYLIAADPNAEYIVGWAPVNQRDGFGHVVNARVANGRITYIDNQNQCRSPNPAAEPPRQAAVIYYAWLTRLNTSVIDNLADTFGRLLIGTAVNRTTPNLSARSLPIGNTTVNFINFTATCRNIALFSNINRDSQVSLNAQCSDERGNFQPTAIILDQSIANDLGSLNWRSNGGFGGSVQNCQINVGINTILLCDAATGSGSFRKVAINLDTNIANRNGKLTSLILGNP